MKDIIRYVEYFLKETKKTHQDVNEVILKSALVYQFLYNKHFNTITTIVDVLKLNGLLGPGNGCIT